MKQRNSLRLVVLLLTALCPLTVAAETVYRWKGPDGNWIYGTKPPAGTKASEAVVGRSFSKYNSDRMIRAFHPRGVAERSGTQPEGELKEVDLVVTDAKLEAAPAMIEVSSSGQITACRATVKNVGKALAKEVLVSFHFADGTIVQGAAAQSAEGNGGIAQNEEREFSVPAKELPLKLSSPATPDTPPEVIVNYVSETSASTEQPSKEQSLPSGNTP